MPINVYRLLADVVVCAHLAFVLFAVFGGLLALRRRPWLWFHVPAVLWAAFVELTGRICPLTPLENWLRARAGERAYRGDFVQHYLIPLLYPADLTRPVQIALGVAVLAVNVAVYGLLVRRRGVGRTPDRGAKRGGHRPPGAGG